MINAVWLLLDMLLGIALRYEISHPLQHAFDFLIPETPIVPAGPLVIFVLKLSFAQRIGKARVA